MNLLFALLVLHYCPLAWRFPTGLWVAAVVIAILDLLSRDHD